MSEQLGGVLRLDRTAIQDPYALRRPLVAIADERPHECDRLLGLLGARHSASTDRPDRLICDRDLRQPLVRDSRKSVPHLLAQLALRVVVIALLLGLAHAQDRPQPG